MLAGRTLRLPGTLYPTDLCVLLFITGGVSLGSGGLGIRDNAAIVFFILAWTTAALTRLREFRQGRRPALKLSGLDLRTTAMLVAGALPWCLMGFLQSVYPTSPIWIPFEVTPPLRVLGMLLAFGVVAEPLFQSIRKPSADADVEHRFSISVFIRSAAILLLSGSPVFTLFSGLWLTVALWPAPGTLLFGFRSIDQGMNAGLIVPNAVIPLEAGHRK